jgi:hypothetical protein
MARDLALLPYLGQPFVLTRRGLAIYPRTSLRRRWRLTRSVYGK